MTTIGIAVVSRIEGGFWMGEAPRRTDSALHTPLELLQPALIVALAGALGVVTGSAFRRPLIAIVAGAFAWFILFPAYWIWNIAADATSIVPVQIMPLRVALPDVPGCRASRGIGSSSTRPSTPPSTCATSSTCRRSLFHTVYLVGLIMVVGAAAARSPPACRAPSRWPRDRARSVSSPNLP